MRLLNTRVLRARFIFLPDDRPQALDTLHTLSVRKILRSLELNEQRSLRFLAAKDQRCFDIWMTVDKMIERKLVERRPVNEAYSIICAAAIGPASKAFL